MSKWLIPVRVGLVVAATVGFFALFTWAANDYKQAQILKAAYKAECKEHLFELGHTAFEIIQASESGCQVATPQGGIPLTIGWGDE